MEYKKAIHALEKEKGVFERLKQYNMKSRVNFTEAIAEIEDAIKQLKAIETPREVKSWNYSTATRRQPRPYTNRGSQTNFGMKK